MIQMTLTQAAQILGLHPANINVEFHGLSIDTRTLQPGNLFIAIPGERVDGHDFVKEAQQKGAVAALVNRPIDTTLPQIQVADISLALGILAAAWRDQFNIPFIAITGSNGKTTLKNMVAAIITAACQNNAAQTLSSQGNFNNHFGLPLTLSKLNKTHRYAVIEMGMNHFGEIAYLTKLTRPNVAVITNAGAAHLEGLGGTSIADVARAKAEIFLGLQADGLAILNRDDDYYTYWREQIHQHQFLSFGFHPESDVHTSLENNQNETITIRTPKGTLTIKPPLLGKHNILNMLAATAATMAINIDLQAIKHGLEKVAPAPGRLQLHQLTNGVKIIDDSYNANPFSLQAAVETLASFAGKKILVLGDMKELGSDAKNLHHSAGEKIRQAGIDYLFTYGELSANTSLTFGEGAYHFNEQEKLVNALKPFLYNQTTILIKGSRSMRMEKVVAELMQ